MALPTVHVRLESDDFLSNGIFVQHIRGTESLSQLFELDVDIECGAEPAPSASDLLGTTVRLVFSADDEEMRVVHGLVSEVHDKLEAPELTSAWSRRYRLRVVPRAFRLTLVETQDVFVDRTLPEIIKHKLELVGLADGVDFEMRLVRSYPAREFVVQYKETDLAFVQRLAEHVGIAYFFEHTGGCDKIVFSDHNAAFGPMDTPRAHGFDARGSVGISSLDNVKKLMPSVFAVQDYNERTPLVDVTGVHELEEGFGGGVVDYAPHTLTPHDAEQLARTRAEERRANCDLFNGRSGALALAAGERFVLVNHPALGVLELLVTEVHHEYSALSYAATGGEQRAQYTNQFKALPTSVVFRPTRKTPKPRISGFVTALVTPIPDALGARELAPKIDGEGRYLVRLHFDTAPPGEEKASCPIRMSQSHAGAGYGMHFPLRPGVEVLVAFLDGDPDRPIIVGAVPNAMTPSPVAASNASLNRIVTASGISINIRDF